MNTPFTPLSPEECRSWFWSRGHLDIDGIKALVATALRKGWIRPPEERPSLQGRGLSESELAQLREMGL